MGRANNIYEAPRELLFLPHAELVEMRRCGSRGLCCVLVQMFKEEEKGTRRVNQERTDDILAAQPTIVASGCPFCMTMLTDGIKEREQQQTEIKVMGFCRTHSSGKRFNLILHDCKNEFDIRTTNKYCRLSYPKLKLNLISKNKIRSLAELFS